MITKRINSNTKSNSSLTGSVLIMTILIVTQLLACNGVGRQTDDMRVKYPLKVNVQKETFQELGFFGEVKKEKWNSFVQAVQRNISHSRKEKGNLSFSLYLPDDRKHQPIWFERFRDKAAHNYHKERDYFKSAITVIQHSLTGKPRSITLKVLDELPVMIPEIADHPGRSRYVIVLFDVKAGKKKPFIEAMAKVVSPSRQTPGNLEFNLYSYVDDPDKFVLIEGWKHQADQEAQLHRGYIKRLNSILDTLLVSNPKDTRWVVKDISQASFHLK